MPEKTQDEKIEEIYQTIKNIEKLMGEFVENFGPMVEGIKGSMVGKMMGLK